MSPAGPPTSGSQSFTAILKANSVDQTKTDIYIRNQKTKEERLFITLPDVCRMNGPDAQYHHGDLYIIRTSGGKVAPTPGGDCSGSGPDFKRELWRYSPDKQGAQIFPGTVGSYLFSADEKVVAIDTGLDMRFLAGDGKVLRTLSSSDVGLENPSLYAWGGSAFWLVEGVGAELPYLVKVEVPGFRLTKFDLTALGIGPEADFDPVKGRIVSSDFPPLYDTMSADEFRASKATVTLFTYDLETKRKQVIATSVTKKFNPKWIGDDTVEYDNPKGKGRLTRRIP
jgi:hypothetical protein